MNKKYITYSMHELLDDAGFISYVINGRNRNEWESLFEISSELKEAADEARKIIESFDVANQSMTSVENLELWRRIVEFDKQNSRENKRMKLFLISRYAALFVLMMSAGIAVWYQYKEEPIPMYQFSASEPVASEGNTLLILQSGETIGLQRENASIRVKDSGTIEIDEEKVIELRQNQSSQVVAMNEIVVPFGRRSRLELGDGTRVWMNAGSRLAFPSEFTGKTREIHLEGEAYFEVSHRVDQPFIVHMREVAVKVLGTRFNITAYGNDDHIQTVLLEGKVSLSDKSTLAASKNETVLVTNQMASIHKTSRILLVEAVADADLYTAWVSGVFRFSRQSLRSVLMKLERYYNVEFVLTGDIGGKDNISGKLDLKDSLDQVLFALAAVKDFHFRHEDDKVIISSAAQRDKK